MNGDADQSPNTGPQDTAQGGTKLHDTVRTIWNEAVRLLHSGKPQSYVDKHVNTLLATAGLNGGTFQELSQFRQRLESAGQGPMEPGEAGTAGRSFVANKMLAGVPGLVSPMARQETEKYESHYPRLARVLGTGAGAVPNIAAGFIPGGPVVRTLAQGAVGGTQAAGNVAPGTDAMGRAIQIGAGAAGAMAGQATGEGLEALMTRGASGLAGRQFIGQTAKLRRGGIAGLGEEGAAAHAAVNPTGNKNIHAAVEPTLGEVRTELGTVLEDVASKSPEGRVQALKAQKANLAKTNGALETVASKYDPALAQTIHDPQLDAVLSTPHVQKFIDQLEDVGLVPKGTFTYKKGVRYLTQPPTARFVNDLRMALEYGPIEKLLDLKGPVPAQLRKLYGEAAGDLESMLSNEVPNFDELQAQYGPIKQQQLERQASVRRLEKSTFHPHPESGGLVPRARRLVTGTPTQAAEAKTYQQAAAALTQPYSQALQMFRKYPLLKSVLPAASGAADTYFQQATQSGETETQ